MEEDISIFMFLFIETIKLLCNPYGFEKPKKASGAHSWVCTAPVLLGINEIKRNQKRRSTYCLINKSYPSRPMPHK